MLTNVLSMIYVAATLTSGVPEYTPAVVKVVQEQTVSSNAASDASTSVYTEQK